MNAKFRCRCLSVRLVLKLLQRNEEGRSQSSFPLVKLGAAVAASDPFPAFIARLYKEGVAKRQGVYVLLGEGPFKIIFRLFRSNV